MRVSRQSILLLLLAFHATHEQIARSLTGIFNDPAKIASSHALVHMFKMTSPLLGYVPWAKAFKIELLS
jgi:hypothetical protein